MRFSVSGQNPEGQEATGFSEAALGTSLYVSHDEAQPHGWHVRQPVWQAIKGHRIIATTIKRRI